MDQAEWSLQDAKNSFSAVVDAAGRGRPQTVTKRGKPAVVVLSVADYERLTSKTQDRPSFVEHLLAIPQGGAGRVGRARIKLRDVRF